MRFYLGPYHETFFHFVNIPKLGDNRHKITIFFKTGYKDFVQILLT